jgi:hypothetical protein
MGRMVKTKHSLLFTASTGYVADEDKRHKRVDPGTIVDLWYTEGESVFIYTTDQKWFCLAHENNIEEVN